MSRCKTKFGKRWLKASEAATALNVSVKNLAATARRKDVRMEYSEGKGYAYNASDIRKMVR